MSSRRPDISVVIPVYDRGALVRHTLDSVRAASSGLDVETVVVDDGSAVPVADDLARLGLRVDRLVRQKNRGLLFARLAGLEAATGRHVLFLDSDDLVSEEKLRAHVAALDAGADVSYTDASRRLLDPERGPAGPEEPEPPLARVEDPAVFFISVQPPPHSPAFRSDYLRSRVASAPFPPSPLYNPVAEIWFYHICAPFPARVAWCPGRAVVCRHSGARLTNHWERLGVASLAVQEAFARSCPSTPEGRRALACFAAKAFDAWRRLPRGFHPGFESRLLSLYERSPSSPAIPPPGGRWFRLAARLLGVVPAGRLFKLRNRSYARCRTLPPAELDALMRKLPPPFFQT